MTANIKPEAMEPANKPPRHLAPTNKPMEIGVKTAMIPGKSISLMEDLVRFDACHVVAHNAFLAFQQARDGAELALNFDDNRARSFSDGQHRQSGEQEWKHRPEDDARQDDGSVSNMFSARQNLLSTPSPHPNGTFLTNAFIMDKAVKTAEPMAKPLPVAAVVLPSASNLSVRLQFQSVVSIIRRHFGDTTGVVRNRTVRISRECDAKRG